MKYASSPFQNPIPIQYSDNHELIFNHHEENKKTPFLINLVMQYTHTYAQMVNVVEKGGRAPPTLTSLG
jgi:hypothetical protein